MENMYKARRQLILNILYIKKSIKNLSDSHILKAIMLVETEKWNDQKRHWLILSNMKLKALIMAFFAKVPIKISKLEAKMTAKYYRWYSPLLVTQGPTPWSSSDRNHLKFTFLLLSTRVPNYQFSN